MESTDFLIVGAGIVRLTVANELRQRHPQASIVVLEKESKVGCHASGRNSGVMHSGIYYSPGTLKAKFCAEGARKMLAFARGKKVPHRLAGMYAGPDGVFRRLVNREVGHYFKARFLAAARRLVPALPEEALEPAAKVGIRPQLVHTSGKLEMDFCIEQTENTLHVLNAISPAFTCALSFSQHIVELAEGTAGMRVPCGSNAI